MNIHLFEVHFYTRRNITDILNLLWYNNFDFKSEEVIEKFPTMNRQSSRRYKGECMSSCLAKNESAFKLKHTERGYEIYL